MLQIMFANINVGDNELKKEKFKEQFLVFFSSIVESYNSEV